MKQNTLRGKANKTDKDMRSQRQIFLKLDARLKR